MANLFVSSAEWILSNLWTILAIAVVIYILVFVRFMLYWTSVYDAMDWKDLPAEIAIPPDVKMGLAAALVLACGSMDYASLITFPNVGTFIVLLVLNILLIGGSLGAILMPLRQYKITLSILREYRKR